MLYEHADTVDRALRRETTRLPASALVLLAVVCAAMLAGALHWSFSLPWSRALVGAVVGGPLSVAAVMVLRSLDARRRLPVGTELVFRVREHGLQYGPAGRERSRPWSEVRAVLLVGEGVVVRCARGDHLAIPARVVGPDGARRLGEIVRSPAGDVRPAGLAPDGAAAGPGPVTPGPDADRRPAVRVDAAAADLLVDDATSAVVRPFRSWALSAPPLALLGVAVVGGIDGLPYAVSGVFAMSVAVRWLVPAVVRRRLRARLLPEGGEGRLVLVEPVPGGFRLEVDGRAVLVGWAQLRRIDRHGDAVVLVHRDGSPRTVLPAEAFPSALLAEGRDAVASAVLEPF